METPYYKQTFVEPYPPRECSVWSAPVIFLTVLAIINFVVPLMDKKKPQKTRLVNAVISAACTLILLPVVVYYSKECKTGWAWFWALLPFIILLVFVILILVSVSLKPRED
uniref:Uncharacterized protein n=1 Tax=viral metagenome TaxID=1070528 RepID=A0A6C0CJG8_9ZZZZ